MLKKSTPLALGAMALAILGSGLYTNSASAQFQGEAGNNLIQKIAQRFNLDETEVKAFFAERKADRQIKRQEKREAKLDQAVENGELTEAQKQLILDKRAELKTSFEANREEFKNLDPEERKTFKTEKRAEIEAWAEANGIDSKYLHPHRGHKKGQRKNQNKHRPTNPNHQQVENLEV